MLQSVENGIMCINLTGSSLIQKFNTTHSNVNSLPIQKPRQLIIMYIQPIYNHCDYRQVSNIRRTLTGYKIVDHSDVVGASPVGAAPSTSSFST